MAARDSAKTRRYPNGRLRRSSKEAIVWQQASESTAAATRCSSNGAGACPMTGMSARGSPSVRLIQGFRRRSVRAIAVHFGVVSTVPHQYAVTQSAA